MAQDSSAGDAFTGLVLEIFRINGRILADGDRLVADLGLTSARWQVLGAIALAGRPLPVSHIARNMGLTRQSVQRVVNELARDGLVDFAANPHHQRAKLILLTAAGEAAYEGASARQVVWAKRIADGIDPAGLDAATHLLGVLRQRLEGQSGTADNTAPDDATNEEDPTWSP